MLRIPRGPECISPESLVGRGGEIRPEPHSSPGVILGSIAVSPYRKTSQLARSRFRSFHPVRLGSHTISHTGSRLIHRVREASGWSHQGVKTSAAGRGPSRTLAAIMFTDMVGYADSPDRASRAATRAGTASSSYTACWGCNCFARLADTGTPLGARWGLNLRTLFP